MEPFVVLVPLAIVGVIAVVLVVVLSRRSGHDSGASFVTIQSGGLPEPTGEMETPRFRTAHADTLLGESPGEGSPALTAALNAMREQIRTALQSPEAMADYAVSTTLQSYVSPRPQNWEALRDMASTPGLQEIGEEVLRRLQDDHYGMKDAKKDLHIKGGKR